MSKVGVLICVIFSLLAAIQTAVLKKRLLIWGPGGDPLHQGGTFYTNQGCVTPMNPCHCSMRYATDLQCLKCDCTANAGVTTSSQGSLTVVSGTATSSASSSTQKIVSTAASTKLTSSPTQPVTFTPSIPPSTTHNFCADAALLCQSNCPNGYLVDPADCTFCVCKNGSLPG